MKAFYEPRLSDDDLSLVLLALDLFDPIDLVDPIGKAEQAASLAQRLRLDLIEGRCQAELVPDKHDVPFRTPPDNDYSQVADVEFVNTHCTACGTQLLEGEEGECDDCKAEFEVEEADTCDRCGKSGHVGLAHGSQYEMVCTDCYVKEG